MEIELRTRCIFTGAPEESPFSLLGLKKSTATAPTVSTASRNRRGLMIILSSPTAAGKSTLAHLLLERDPEILLSVSVTTRPRRSNEQEGVHYHFVTRERFLQMRDAGVFLEWAEVHGDFYGTPSAPIAEALDSGHDVLFDIDVQGAHQLTKACPGDVVSIFILPPSFAEMKARLLRRAEDNPDSIRRRFDSACQEIQHWSSYTYLLINEELEEAFAQLHAIIEGARHTTSHACAARALAETLEKELMENKNAAPSIL